jgi:cysteinyl-tRNA synthetase
MKYLGETLDIHGGGLDLQFPHHENELAQSESFTEKPFALAWMHNGLLKMGTAKMAGSVGNVVNVVDLLKQHSPETVRFLLLSTHYRSPIEWSDERLAEVGRALEGFYRFFERYERIIGVSFYHLSGGKPTAHPLSGPIGDIVLVLRKRFLECLDDDFNTGGAVGVLFEILPALNRYADTAGPQLNQAGPTRDAFNAGVRVLRELSQILGLFWAPPAEKKLGGDDKLVAGLMQLLIDVRNNLRAEAKKITAKDDPLKKAMFEQTDLIRKRLGALGVTLEDRPVGTGWRVG